MKKIILGFTALLVVATLVAWGTFGHEHINKAAVFALPAQSPVQLFFYNHIDFITQESTVPDLRKHTINDKAEGPRHYIDMENFGSPDTLPKTLSEAKKKYDDKFLQQNGILPWYVDELMDKLTKAFREKKKTEILFLAADIGHYIGDAHMPLHTSANHDGQLTNQKGIHALWESRLPEVFGKNYNYNTPEAKLIEDVRKEIWNIVKRSHTLVDSVLNTDRALREKNTEKKIFKTDPEGKILKSRYGQQIFSEDYTKQFHKALNGMVEKQMQAAIAATASFWYTAWVNAGKPDLTDLDPQELSKRNAPFLEEELKLWKEGKLFGIESEKEF
ncbi:MAG: zinc dependent phospholipase C family protein [Bacteroidia bacterium]